MPGCSVIIPVFNNHAITKQCLDATLGTCGRDTAIIVVDDGSADGTPAMLAAYGDRLTVVRHSVNEGFAKTCNDGAAAASGEFLVFLNNDTIPQPGWLDALVDYSRANPQAAVVGAKLLYPNDTIQHAGMAICEKRHPIHIYKGFPAGHDAVNKSRAYPVVTGACFFTTREHFTKMRGFDTAYRNGYEDVDFCLRTREAGMEVHYCHKSVLYHLESSTRQHDTPCEQKNLRLFHERWGGHVRQDDFTYYFQDGLLRLHYTQQHPVQITCSPILATPFETGEDREQMNHLLYYRMLQVNGLVQENLKLLVSLGALNNGNGANGHTHSKSKPPEPVVECESEHESELRSLKQNHEKFKTELQQSTDKLVALLETMPGKTAIVKALQQHEAELREMLVALHEQLMHRDEMIILGNVHRFQGMLGELQTFLDRMDEAVARLYSSRRWALANLGTIFSKRTQPRESSRGYWRIDDTLNAYRLWRERHVVPLGNLEAKSNGHKNR